MILKIVWRVVVFILSVLLVSYLLKFLIAIGYNFMLNQYSLPKIDFDVTLLSLFISTLFLAFLSVVSDYWKISRFIKIHKVHNDLNCEH